VLAKGIKLDFWQALKKELELSAESNLMMQDELLDSDNPGDSSVAYAKVRGFRKANLAYKATIANVEKSDERIERLNREVQDYSRQINSLQEKEGDTPIKGGNREVKNQVC